MMDIFKNIVVVVKDFFISMFSGFASKSKKHTSTGFMVKRNKNVSIYNSKFEGKTDIINNKDLKLNNIDVSDKSKGD